MAEFFNDPFDDDEFDDEEEILRQSDYIMDLFNLQEYYDSIKENSFKIDLDTLEEYISLAMEIEEYGIGAELSEIYLKYNPYDSDIWQKKGIFHINDEEYELAIEALNKAYLLNPTDIDTLLYLFNAHYLKNDHELAKYYLNLARDLNLGDEDIEDYYIDNIIDIDPEQAITLIKSNLEKDPDNIDNLNYLAEAYLKLNKIDESIFYYEKILEIDPYDAETWVMLSDIYISKGDFEKAIEYVENANAINEEMLDSYFILANSLLLHKKYDEAIKYYKTYLEFEPTNAEAYYKLGVSYESIENFKDAIEAYTKAIEYDDGYENSFILTRGYCYLKMNEFEKAEDDFIKYIDLHPKDIEGYLGMSQLFYKMGRKDEALKFLMTANDYSPNNQLVLFNLSFLSYELGDNVRALDYIDKTLKLEPDSADAHYLRAQILFKTNNYDEGFKSLQTSFDLNSTFKEKFEKEFPKIANSKEYKERFPD